MNRTPLLPLTIIGKANDIIVLAQETSVHHPKNGFSHAASSDDQGTISSV